MISLQDFIFKLWGNTQTHQWTLLVEKMKSRFSVMCRGRRTSFPDISRHDHVKQEPLWKCNIACANVSKVEVGENPASQLTPLPLPRHVTWSTISTMSSTEAAPTTAPLTPSSPPPVPTGTRPKLTNRGRSSGPVASSNSDSTEIPEFEPFVAPGPRGFPPLTGERQNSPHAVTGGFYFKMWKALILENVCTHRTCFRYLDIFFPSNTPVYPYIVSSPFKLCLLKFVFVWRGCMELSNWAPQVVVDKNVAELFCIDHIDQNKPVLGYWNQTSV